MCLQIVCATIYFCTISKHNVGDVSGKVLMEGFRRVTRNPKLLALFPFTLISLKFKIKAKVSGTTHLRKLKAEEPKGNLADFKVTFELYLTCAINWRIQTLYLCFYFVVTGREMCIDWLNVRDQAEHFCHLKRMLLRGLHVKIYPYSWCK